jgi:hypothetical protein
MIAMTFDHAKTLVHHLGRLLGTTPGAAAHSNFATMHRGLSERQQKEKLVEYVDRMRGNSYLTTNDDGVALLAFADATKAELAAEGG